MKRFLFILALFFVVPLFSGRSFATSCTTPCVQHAANETTNANTTLTCGAGSPVPWASSGAGHLIVVQLRTFGGNTSSVSGNVNGAYTSVFNVSGGGSAWGGSVWYFKNSGSGDSTITATQAAGGFDLAMRCLEFGGMNTSAPLDDFIPATVGIPTTKASPWQIPQSAASLNKSFTQAQANEVLIGNVVSDTGNGATTISTDATWTKIDERNVAGFSNLDNRNDYLVTNSIHTYDSTHAAYFGTVSANSVVMDMVAFKQASTAIVPRKPVNF